MAIFSKKNTSNDTVAPDSFEVLPKHLGIIMDGNGRWAKKRALPRSAGHKAGAEVKGMFAPRHRICHFLCLFDRELETPQRGS